MQRTVRFLPVLGLLLAGGCLKTTPFDTNPEERDLNEKNLTRLLGTSPPERFTFVAMGCSHDAYDDAASLADLVNKSNDVELVVHAGDITDRGLLQEFEWSNKALSRFHAPLLMSIGNHDSISAGKEIYWKMYGPYDYTFVWGGMKWIFFNSNTLDFDGRAPDRDWLTREVQDRSGANGVILVTHHPPVNTDDLTGGDVERFYRNLLGTGGVNLYVHAHLHEFRYYRVHGVPVVQSSTFEKPREYARITLDGTAIEVERCRFEKCELVESERDYGDL